MARKNVITAKKCTAICWIIKMKETRDINSKEDDANELQ
jgi:hypothetical protein